MCAFIAPVADDPVTKLQNLLQNTLHSFADITITLGPEKAEEFRQECLKLGITLPEGEENPEPTAGSPVDQDGNATNAPSASGSIQDRVARLGILNDHIQATVDDLPDLRVPREQIAAEVKLLNEECQRAADELRTLYKQFDTAFNTLREHLNKDS
ncbi:large ribosomal protein subunit processing, putative [Babesia ovis]|uniref:Large ribosomal protein subunit processing, putative n=1 Tax=Babesia ovis TaxID=5869 RepID=A0A9W5WUZ2_BABOV|nr:large ribosomal protein subunit processing, putative [Babesia ovis]